MTFSGALNFATVAQHLKRADGLIADGTLDLSALTHCDSAGLALLLELQRRAQSAGKTIKFKGAGAKLKDLVHSYGLGGILTLA